MQTDGQTPERGAQTSDRTWLGFGLLLLADWSLRRDRPLHDRPFRLLAGTLVALLFVVAVSAVQRMRLYQAEFGLTELRLYTTVFVAWLAVAFVWFVLTVLRRKRERFAFGALVAGLIAVAGLNAANRDALIARTNLERGIAGLALDGRYATSLSADAAPALVEMLPGLPDGEHQRIASRILERWSDPPQGDWRAWNWARCEAWRAVGANLETLQKAARTAS